MNDFIEFKCDACGCEVKYVYNEGFSVIELAGDKKIQLCCLCSDHYNKISKYNQREYIRAILESKRE